MARPRPLRLAAALTALTLACVYGGFIGGNLLHGIDPAIGPPALALAPILYLLATRRVAATDGLGPSAAPVTALAAIVAAPVLAAHAHLALALPIIKVQDGRDPAFVDAGLILLATLAASVLVVGFGARVLLRCDLGILSAPLRFAAPLATALVLLLVLVGARSPRPSPGRWVASLPVVASLPDAQPRTPNLDSDTDVDDVTLVRRCNVSGCKIWLQRRGWDPAPEPDLTTTERVELRHDAANALWVLDTRSGAEAHYFDKATGRAAFVVPGSMAFRGPNLARVDVRVKALARSLAPPRGWLVAAAIGATWALAMLVRRRAAQRKLDEILAAEAGTLDEDGWITLDRGTSRLRAGVEVKAGPVLVLVTGTAGTFAYRSAGADTAERVLAGTREDLADDARRSLATLDARAFVAATVAAAPLALAWLTGLR